MEWNITIISKYNFFATCWLDITMILVSCYYDNRYHYSCGFNFCFGIISNSLDTVTRCPNKYMIHRTHLIGFFIILWLNVSRRIWKNNEFFNDFQALEKAKESGRKERILVRQREQIATQGEQQLNLDLTYSVRTHMNLYKIWFSSIMT